MSSMMQAVEMTAMIDAGRQLHLDRDLPIGGPTRVRVILRNPVLLSPSFLRKQESIRVFALSTSLMDSCFRRNDGLSSFRYPLDDLSITIT